MARLNCHKNYISNCFVLFHCLYFYSSWVLYENTSCLSVKIWTILSVPYTIFLAGLASFHSKHSSDAVWAKFYQKPSLHRCDIGYFVKISPFSRINQRQKIEAHPDVVTYLYSSWKYGFIFASILSWVVSIHTRTNMHVSTVHKPDFHTHTYMHIYSDW